MASAKEKMARDKVKARMWIECVHLHPSQGIHFPLALGTGLQTSHWLMAPNRTSQESARAERLQGIFCSISYLQKFTLSSGYITSTESPKSPRVPLFNKP